MSDTRYTHRSEAVPGLDLWRLVSLSLVQAQPSSRFLTSGFQYRLIKSVPRGRFPVWTLGLSRTCYRACNVTVMRASVSPAWKRPGVANCSFSRSATN